MSKGYFKDAKGLHFTIYSSQLQVGKFAAAEDHQFLNALGERITTIDLTVKSAEFEELLHQFRKETHIVMDVVSGQNFIGRKQYFLSSRIRCISRFDNSVSVLGRMSTELGTTVLWYKSKSSSF